MWTAMWIKSNISASIVIVIVINISLGRRMICIFNIKKILKKSNRIYVNHINLMQDNIKKHEIQNQINILAPTSYLPPPPPIVHLRKNITIAFPFINNLSSIKKYNNISNSKLNH